MWLQGLPGTDGSARQADELASFSQTIISLQSGRAVTTAGDSGAVNLWIDDDGNYRCAFLVHLKTANELVTKSASAVGKWMDEFVPRCKGRYAEAAEILVARRVYQLGFEMGELLKDPRRNARAIEANILEARKLGVVISSILDLGGA